ncbi:unnamed protein product [Rotaria magnacalcarata]|uniref:Trafficking protein particle complex subunit n=2 Tax=Rotaria magnacalcarata TaxID=392030 RepID=A0A814FQM9_9BILA|nr:unnamed protein product [Rotaria magnacalcarata]CAF1358646.1 unnamed protein product [Rotaria magnacalcarata]CAF1933945.1 unnamed protein product [Rotaria magnacalcarata]CAF1942721.1 unnamed protein product [Rotaria magnacalcarata]CAF2036812.1 unnamed protein product [Rotaria magnacalcarata]
MVVHSFYVINRSGGLIFSYEHSIPKIELEKTFSYPLDFVLKQGQKGVAVEFGQRDGIKVGHTILSINGVPTRGNNIDFSSPSPSANTDDDQPATTSTSHDVIEYLSDPVNYPVTIKFGRTRLNGNEKLILASIFHSMYAIACQLSPELNSTGIRELETDQFKLNCFQSVTGSKFIALTDIKQVNVDALLKRSYELYSDYALKNPFYSVEQPIWCPLFQESVKQAIDSLEKTGLPNA